MEELSRLLPRYPDLNSQFSMLRVVNISGSTWVECPLVVAVIE